MPVKSYSSFINYNFLEVSDLSKETSMKIWMQDIKKNLSPKVEFLWSYILISDSVGIDIS
jgi:hypothetical protein